jgi:isoleucyl-tRNA synthetase
VTLGAGEPLFSLLSRYQEHLRALFIVSALELVPAGNGASAVQVEVARAEGLKCERCWNYSTHVGEDPLYPTVCERCSAALKEF